VLCSQRFVDCAPDEVVATLLDEDAYFCAERTMYRVLGERDPVQERRAPRVHPEYTKPELIAGPPTRSGPGTSRGCSARRSGPTTTCM
jgi:putative transposase